MKTDKSKPILVTGGTGYIASWIIKYLLTDGYNVKASVRNKSDQHKYQHLIDIADHEKGSLEIFEADLTHEGAFDEAVKDCELIIHTASPFKITGIEDPEKDLIEPALQGTRNVLNAAGKTDTVKRIVLTSSVVAMYGDAIDIKNTKNGYLTEENWNTTSNSEHQPYPYSKTLAEKEAWKLAENQNQWDLVVINPGFVLGPSLTKRKDSTSINIMIGLGNGEFRKGVPGMGNAVVDVRDVAKAHISAGFTETASGRHICAAQTSSFLEMANILRKYFPNHPLPKSEVPKWLFMIVGPKLGFSRRFIKRNIGYPIKFDNSYIRKDLGIEFRPLEDTLKDHFEQLIKDGLIKAV